MKRTLSKIFRQRTCHTRKNAGLVAQLEKLAKDNLDEAERVCAKALIEAQAEDHLRGYKPSNASYVQFLGGGSLPSILEKHIEGATRLLDHPQMARDSNGELVLLLQPYAPHRGGISGETLAQLHQWCQSHGFAFSISPVGLWFLGRTVLIKISKRESPGKEYDEARAFKTTLDRDIQCYEHLLALWLKRRAKRQSAEFTLEQAIKAMGLQQPQWRARLAAIFALEKLGCEYQQEIDKWKPPSAAKRTNEESMMRSLRR